MQPVVETLSGLERRVDLAVSVADVEKEVQAQLKRVARTAKVPGFRPGKAPLAMLERSHGPGIRYDVINNQVGRAFEQAVDGAKLRVAGAPNLEPRPKASRMTRWRSPPRSRSIPKSPCLTCRAWPSRATKPP